MIRFQPDTLGQAFLRYFDMAAPDANVYVEIAAPDIRFAAIVLLALAAAICWRRLGRGRRATMAMLLLLLLSSVIWLATTGNGRYFMPLLVAAGPIAVALICLLPLARRMKGTLVLLLLAGQVFVISEQPPWNTWTFLHWKRAPYFEVSLRPEETQAPPTTYATLSLISYSLIAPQFPPASRWINLPTGSGTPRDNRWIDEFLRDAAARGPMRAIAPSLPSESLPDGRPKPAAVVAMDELLTRRNLRIDGQCGYIGAPAFQRMAERERSAKTPSQLVPGFWSCPIVYDPRAVARQRVEQPPEAVLRSLARLAELCPRFFPNDGGILRLPDAWTRHYTTETRVYVTDSGEVWYKFWRSMNPVFVGRVDKLLAGKVEIDCNAIRGSDGAWRSGAK